jgi:hypothetical protein
VRSDVADTPFCGKRRFVGSSILSAVLLYTRRLN